MTIYKEEDLLKWYDEEYCLAAIKPDGNVLRFVKDQTEEMCIEAVKYDGKFIKYVNENFLTRELILTIFKRNVNSEVLNYNKYDKNDLILQYIPKYLQRGDICLEAVKMNSDEFDFVNEELKTDKMYSLYIKQRNSRYTDINCNRHLVEPPPFKKYDNLTYDEELAFKNLPKMRSSERLV